MKLDMLSYSCNVTLFYAEDIEPITFRYVSIGDVAHVSTYQPHLAAVYKNVDGNFALPIGYDLVSIPGHFI
jgi:hypothetical protein